jgi:hypothetical protein
MSLATKLANVPAPTKHEPPWAGPESDAKNGGCTQSMLSRYVSCRERFRVKVIDGWGPSEKFEPAIEYGSLWHEAEQAFAGRTADGNPVEKAFTTGNWQGAVRDYAVKLLQRFPFQQDQVQHWHDMCLAQFPQYVEWWSRHPDMEARTPLLAEQVFHVPYCLPSGRIVWLRGKWDSVDLVEDSGIWLQENKSKSSIDVQKIGRQLTFDLQTLLYIITLQKSAEIADSQADGWAWTKPVRGVRYNVVRRSAHKSTDSMLKKIAEDVSNGRGGEWFARWNVEITAEDVAKFKREFLDPCLECLCDDYEWWMYCSKQCRTDEGWSVFDYQHRSAMMPHHVNRHYRTPYGIYSVVHEGGVGETDNYLATGSTVGLTRITNLFPELEDV